MAGGIISLPQTVQQEEKNNLVLTMMTLIMHSEKDSNALPHLRHYCLDKLGATLAARVNVHD